MTRVFGRDSIGGGVFGKGGIEHSVLKRALKLMLFAGMTVGMAWAAENPFIGEWKLNPSKSRMPDEMKVESKGGNTYSFNFGGGAETIVADGTDQPGNRGTTLSVRADGADTWIVERKKDGRLLLRATWKLSKDGGALTDLIPCVRARQVHDQPGLCLPAQRWRIGLRGGLAEYQGN